MLNRLSTKYIKQNVADTSLIFQRGCNIYEHGSFFLAKGNFTENSFVYEVDGNYGNYTTSLQLGENAPAYSCSCPYPGEGCKHIVAAMLNARDLLFKKSEQGEIVIQKEDDEDYLTEAQIKKQALDDRRKRGGRENFKVIPGDMVKGDHLVINKNHMEYTVTLHNPQTAKGHCSCPDYLTNGLGTCKHLEYLANYIKKKPGYKKRVLRERFPFTDIFWDSVSKSPMLFTERPENELEAIKPVLDQYFDKDGRYKKDTLGAIMALLYRFHEEKGVCVRPSLIDRVDRFLEAEQLKTLSKGPMPDLPLKTDLYPYQKAGVAFGAFKRGVLIGDEMGLGKTLQAISLGLLKKELFGFSRIIVVTLASLKEQWKREIERFSDETAAIVAGSPDKRKATYFTDKSLFKITNYEAVLRDVMILARYKPDVVILDEAQRIKNFSTKTAEAVKRIPKKHGIVLTGTPLENKLEDVYSIVQFLDPHMLTPLWKFAADHFLISKKKKGSIAGYKNLVWLKEKLGSIVIRRKKEEVLTELPKEVVNNYYIDLTEEQQEIHSGYLRALVPLMNKKYLTPMDLRRIQVLLLRMRMVCNSTFLIDRETHLSPKLKELEGILDEMVLQNKRKLVVFSEWTTMTFLIARHLSDVGIPFVELSGKVPVKKRQALIDEFTNNPECRVFLSTDAGGTGLNLQAADCVVNFELPWNPAKMNQRIGRVSRIGQKSDCINVVNLISKNSIEERILTGIQLKTDLFKGVFDDGPDRVEFSREKRTELLNHLRNMMGEEIEPGGPEAIDSEEIPEDAPHFLNPEVLSREEELFETEATNLTAFKEGEKDSPKIAAKKGGLLSRQDASARPDDPKVPEKEDNMLAAQPPEKMETVLNSGLEFLGGLMEMATGQTIEASKPEEKMITIDKESGEVTMRFKLPGFK